MKKGGGAVDFLTELVLISSFADGSVSNGISPVCYNVPSSEYSIYIPNQESFVKPKDVYEIMENVKDSSIDFDAEL